MKMEFSSEMREMLLFLTTNMATVTSRANQQYATFISPIKHLIAPLSPSQKENNFFAYVWFSISVGTAVIPRRNEKQRLCTIWGLGGANKVHYGRCAGNEDGVDLVLIQPFLLCYVNHVFLMLTGIFEQNLHL